MQMKIDLKKLHNIKKLEAKEMKAETYSDSILKRGEQN